MESSIHENLFLVLSEKIFLHAVCLLVAYHQQHHHHHHHFNKDAHRIELRTKRKLKKSRSIDSKNERNTAIKTTCLK